MSLFEIDWIFGILILLQNFHLFFFITNGPEKKQRHILTSYQNFVFVPNLSHGNGRPAMATVLGPAMVTAVQWSIAVILLALGWLTYGD